MSNEEIETNYVNTRHGRIHVRVAGKGPPLLLLHATPKSSRSFKTLLPHLALHHRVIAPDTLGFGESDPLPAEPTIHMLADSMADLLESLKAHPCAVFGIHTGNKIGAALANRHSAKVSRFVLCGMTHSIVLDRSIREAAIKALVQKPFTGTDISDDERLDRKQGEGSVDTIYDANYGFDLSESLSTLALPTLVLELVTPAEEHLGRHANAIANRLKNGTGQTFYGSDRDALNHRPDDFAALLLSFTALPYAN